MDNFGILKNGSAGTLKVKDSEFKINGPLDLIDKVLEIANECVYNDNIPVEGLTLKYSLDENTHKKLDEELFYKTN